MNGRMGREEVSLYAQAYAEVEIAGSEPADRPTAVIMVSQPGAGSSTLAREHIVEELSQAGGFVWADSEVLRTRLPYFNDLDPAEVDVVKETAADVHALELETHQLAAQARRNLLIDSATSSPDDMLHLASDLKRAGYQVEVHALAVNDQISYERATHRYEQDRRDGDPGIYIDQREHDRGVRDASDTVRRLEYAGAVDRITVYNRLNDVILDHKPEPGRIVAGEAFDRARNQMTDFERISLAEKWDDIMEMMERRGASQPEFDRVLRQVARAHYTLQASPEAAASYGYDNPTERAGSQDLAKSYGAKLEAAFRHDRKDQAAVMPELAKAFVSYAAAMKVANDGPSPAPPDFADALRDRMAAGLRRGDQLRDTRVRESSLYSEQDQLLMAGRKGAIVTGVMEYDDKPVTHLMYARHESGSGQYYNLAMHDGSQPVASPRGVKPGDLDNHIGERNANAIRQSRNESGALQGHNLHYDRGYSLDRLDAFIVAKAERKAADNHVSPDPEMRKLQAAFDRASRDKGADLER